MASYQVHEDFANIRINIPFFPVALSMMQVLTRLLYTRQPVEGGVEHQRTLITTEEGRDIPVEIFRPIEQPSSGPCLLFIHGGAFALPATGHHKRLICDYALGCSCTVVSVDYRLAPRYPYPHGLDDCLCSYRWLIENAPMLDIDVDRIGICGDSAGGALAAALTLMIRDRALSRPRFLMLVYPVLDARLSTDSMKKYLDTPVWNAKLNTKMWNLYLSGHPEAIEDPYASPSQAESLENLPATYIEVNEFDCLRDEALAYHERLLQAGIEVVLVEHSGTVHGFELNYGSSVTREIIRTRVAYMRRGFSDTSS